MNTFYIITNEQKDPGFRVTTQIQKYLSEKGARCLVPDHTKRNGMVSYKYTDASQIPEDTQCVLVIGGDGTLLQASRDLQEKNIPLLGINMGTLGYLAEIEESGVRDALDKLLADEYVVEERMMLELSLIHILKFKEELAVRTKQAEEVIRSFLPFEEGFQKTLFEAMNYSMTAGGKRLRPCLLYTSKEKAWKLPFPSAIIQTTILVKNPAFCGEPMQIPCTPTG